MHTKRGGRVRKATGRMLVVGSLMLGAGGAQLQGTDGLRALLQQPEGALTLGVELSPAQVGDELIGAGLTLVLVAWSAQGPALHVFHDAARNRYVSVSGSSPTRLWMSAGMPSLDGSLLIME